MTKQLIDLQTETVINRGVLPDQIGFNLRLAYFTVTQIFADVFADLKIVPIQFAILEIISHNDLLSQKEIATHIGTAPSVIVKPIRDLETRGLVERTRSEIDRRNHHICLTGDGRAFQVKAHEHISRVEAELSSNLSMEEQETLLRLLQKINSETG